MSIENEILNFLPKLSKGKRKVANYILENPNEVIKMKVAQLAKVANSSPATVIRFVKDLKKESFMAFKIELSADLSKESLKTSYEDIFANESLDSIKQKLLANAQRAVKETFEQLDERELKPFVAELLKYRQIIVFGVGASALVAENIAQKWSRLGYLAIAEHDLNSMLPQLANNRGDTIIWLISNSGKSPEIVDAATYAWKNEFPIIAIIGRENSILERYIKNIVHTAPSKESNHRIAATSSLLSQFSAIDIIFYYFVSQNYEVNVGMLRNSYEIVAEYRKGLNYRK